MILTPIWPNNAVSEWATSYGVIQGQSANGLWLILHNSSLCLLVVYDACDKQSVRVSSLSLVRYRGNDYSVPTSYGHSEVLVRGYVHEVVITCGTQIIARHPRSWEKEDFIFDPLHYLALIEQKTNALDQAAPLADWKLPEDLRHTTPPA